jgi:hypothetical protein
MKFKQTKLAASLAALLITTNAFAGVIGSPNDHMGPGMGPVINVGTFPAPAVGDSTSRIGTAPITWGGPSDIGAFRTFCKPSHYLFDDPLVFPGQPGRSHLHLFFGNTAANANLTSDTILQVGNSTCPGGTANRTAYWVPALVDTRTGQPVKSEGNETYYKSGYNGMLPYQLQNFPTGLKMIAGTMNADANQTTPYRWQCIGMGSENMKGNTIQNCPVGATLWMMLTFPQCWDGRNLDSADHKSHMSYAVLPSAIAPRDATGKYQTQWGDARWCPASHPIPVPEIGFNVQYKITEQNQPLYWQLSSDMYEPKVDWTRFTTDAGKSVHGDWMNGWRPDVIKKWVANCVTGIGEVPGGPYMPRDCHNELLGDGDNNTRIGTTLY